MRRIPFPLESYQHPSLPLVAKRLLNVMAEKAPDDARVAAALVSTPGLLAWTTALGGSGPIGAGPILAMNDDMPGRIYIVSGTQAFRLYFPVAGGVTVDYLGTSAPPNSGTGSWNSFPNDRRRAHRRGILLAPKCIYLRPHPGTILNQIGGVRVHRRNLGLLCRRLFRVLGTRQFGAVVHLAAARSHRL